MPVLVTVLVISLQKDSQLKILIIIFSTLFLYSCGGGGGGSTAGSTGTSAFSALSWTPSGTYYGTGYTIGLGEGMASPIVTNASKADTESYYSDSMRLNVTGSQFSLWYNRIYQETQEFTNWNFNSSDYSSSSSGGTNTLNQTIYNYQNYDSVNGKTKSIAVGIPSNYSSLFWMFWDNTHSDYSGDNRNNYHTNVFGMNTPFANLPASGSASYSGGMSGDYAYADGVTYFFLRGDASFNIDWSSKSISGGFTNLTLENQQTSATQSFPNISMASSTITSDSLGGNNFAYFTNELTGSGLTSSYYGVGTSDLYGYFYGTAGQEIGGSWEIVSDAGAHGAGTFAAK